MTDIERVLDDNLTPPQAAAARDGSREVLTLACAGSGKSRTLAYRIARLVALGSPPESIVAFTFTEKAAESIKLRVAQALESANLDPTSLGAMFIGTIHSYCQYVLTQMDARYRQFGVLDVNRLKLFLISRYPALELPALRRNRSAKYFETINEVSKAWSTVNDELLQINQVTASDPVLGATLNALCGKLESDQFIDFSMMIRRVVEALQRNEAGAERAVSPLRHLMVDEYQDVNPAQEALIEELHSRSDTLFVVGDDDQGIYAWRGADIRNILSFQDRHARCSRHTLATNFRSTEAIVSSADAFAHAELGPSRFTKNPDADETVTPRDFRRLWLPSREEEARWVADRVQLLLHKRYVEKSGNPRGLTPGDFAILMRSTRTGDVPCHQPFTDALSRLGIPYTLEAGGSVFDRPQVAALASSFELLRDGPPTREQARRHFDERVVRAFPVAEFSRLVAVLTEWGRLIHEPTTGVRRRVYPQKLVHELLGAFGLAQTPLDEGVMRDIGTFSRMIQDVESVYVSIDSTRRFVDILNFLQQVAPRGYDTSTDDVLLRPDAVTVSTVHQVKGLEFPVVFIVDAESARFPGRIRRYDGWLPLPVIQPALDRGAYHTTRDGEARLFYTALTRAERFLYVTGSERLPRGTKRWKQSPFALRLSHAELSSDPSAVPSGIAPWTPSPRRNDVVVPTSYSDIRYYLTCPRNYQFRKSYGFSPSIPDLFGFGMTVHAAIGKLHESFRDNAPSGEEAERLARDIFHLKHVPPSGDPERRPGAYERARDEAARIVRAYGESFTGDFTMERQVEIRFEVPLQFAVVSGAIDLLLKHDDQGHIVEASVVDFKTMEGGESPAESARLQWTDLSLQVQLYAKAAREVLGENARTGHVHLLKDGHRVEVPVDDAAVQAAVVNVEWAVERILDADFPMRPHADKCASCDFKLLCPASREEFGTTVTPPLIHVPGSRGPVQVQAFSKVEAD